MTTPLTKPVGLAKLKRAEDHQTPPPIVTIYGTGGIGKSTFASEFPSPLFLDVESGLTGIKADRIPVETYGDVIETIKALLADPQGFKTLVVDTLDAFEPLLWAETARRNGWSSVEDAGFGKGYIAAADIWRTEVIGGLQALRSRQNFTVILLAHSQVKTFQSPQHENWDRYELRLHKSASALITEFSDVVGFASYDVKLKKENGGFNKTRARAIGDGSRLLLLEERPAAIAKNRFSLPDEIEFSAAAFIRAMRASITNNSNEEKEPANG